jgi:hypothetical protein
MKAVLEFDLPEDNAAYELAINAAKYNLALHAISREIRNMAKYQNRKSITVEELRKLFYTTLEECGINEESL